MHKLSTIKNKRNYCIGLSICSNQISYVRVFKNEVIDEGIIKYTNVSSALQENKKLFSEGQCYLALPLSYVLLKKICLTECLQEIEINNLLRMNTKQYFSNTHEAINYDFEFLNDQKTQFRFIASKKQEVDSWLTHFKNASLQISLITVNMLAVESFLIHYLQISQDLTYVVFVYGHANCLQLIISNLRIEFYRDAANLSSSDSLALRKFVRQYQINRSPAKPIDQGLVFNERRSDSICYSTIGFPVTFYSSLELMVGQSLSIAALIPLGVTVR